MVVRVKVVPAVHTPGGTGQLPRAVNTSLISPSLCAVTVPFKTVFGLLELLSVDEIVSVLKLLEASAAGFCEFGSYITQPLTSLASLRQGRLPVRRFVKPMRHSP